MLKVLRPILLLTLLWTLPVHGAPSCLQVFSTASLNPLSYLDAAKLKKWGFSVYQDKDGAYNLLDLKKARTLSTLAVVDAPYLYEWAGLQEQQGWLKSGGISTADMKYILESTGQSFGKGYYVSTNIYDSATYGVALSVFKTTHPLIALNLNGPLTAGLDTATVRRLRAAGIDALGTSQPTWFSIINEQQLRINHQPIQDPLLTKKTSDPYFRSDIIALRMMISGIRDQVPATSPLRKAFHAQYDFNEVVGGLKTTTASELRRSEQSLEKLKAFIKKFQSADLSLAEEYFGGLTRILTNKKTKSTVMHGEIKDLKSLAVLVATRVGHDLQIRNHFAEVTDDVGQAQTFAFDAAAWDHFALYGANKFLGIHPVDSTQPAAGANFEYFNLKSVVASNLYSVLPPELAKQFETLELSRTNYDIYEKNPAGKSLLRKTLRQAAETLMVPTSGYTADLINAMNGAYLPATPGLLYRTFLSIHPFETDNELAAQIYLEWVSGKMNGESQTANYLMPKSPLFITRDKISLYTAVNDFLQAWISAAPDASQATVRRQLAETFLSSVYGEIRTLNTTENQ